MESVRGFIKAHVGSPVKVRAAQPSKRRLKPTKAKAKSNPRPAPARAAAPTSPADSYPTDWLNPAERARAGHEPQATQATQPGEEYPSSWLTPQERARAEGKAQQAPGIVVDHGD